MPIYEYYCKTCGVIKENFQPKIDDNPKWITCKKCKKRMQRIMSLSSFSLKGDGWSGKDIKNNK